MEKTLKITLHLVDGNVREFVGNRFRINNPDGPTQVWDTEKNEAVWSEQISNGRREIVKFEIDKVAPEEAS